MIRKIIILTIVLLISGLFVTSSFAQGLSINSTPTHGTHELGPGKLTYVLKEIDVGGQISLASFRQSSEYIHNKSECGGYVRSAPDAVILWESGWGETDIAISVTSGTDTVLYVLVVDFADNEASHYCSDNQINRNPAIVAEDVSNQARIYIYIGTSQRLSRDGGATAYLYISDFSRNRPTERDTSSSQSPTRLGGLDIVSYCQDKLLGAYEGAEPVDEFWLNEFGIAGHDGEWLCIFSDSLSGRILNGIRRGTIFMGSDWFLVDLNDVCQDQHNDNQAYAQQDGSNSNPAYNWSCYTTR